MVVNQWLKSSTIISFWWIGICLEASIVTSSGHLLQLLKTGLSYTPVVHPLKIDEP